jgi:hypothetical protein
MMEKMAGEGATLAMEKMAGEGAEPVAAAAVPRSHRHRSQRRRRQSKPVYLGLVVELAGVDLGLGFGAVRRPRRSWEGWRG